VEKQQDVSCQGPGQPSLRPSLQQQINDLVSRGPLQPTLGRDSNLFQRFLWLCFIFLDSENFSELTQIEEKNAQIPAASIST